MVYAFDIANNVFHGFVETNVISEWRSSSLKVHAFIPSPDKKLFLISKCLIMNLLKCETE